MGRKYTASVAPAATAAAMDLFEILAASTHIIVVHEWEIWQTTDLGDAAEEVLTLECVEGIGTVTSGSGGSSPNKEPHEEGDAAADATVEGQNTTRMAVGTGTLRTKRFGWNIRVPLTKIYTPETRPIIAPGNRWTLGMPAPADSITVGARVTWEEIGS